MNLTKIPIEHRRAWLRANPGLLRRASDAWSIPFPTLSAAWTGRVAKPKPAVVRALNEQLRRAKPPSEELLMAYRKGGAK